MLCTTSIMVDDLMQVCEKYLVLVANPATFPPWFVNETPPSFELTAIGLATPLTLQVKIECGKGRLEQGQSPVFYPNDPTKASARSTLGPYVVPRVYVHAPHRYFSPSGIPGHPPCPKCGWEAVKKKQVSL